MFVTIAMWQGFKMNDRLGNFINRTHKINHKKNFSKQCMQVVRAKIRCTKKAQTFEKNLKVHEKINST